LSPSVHRASTNKSYQNNSPDKTIYVDQSGDQEHALDLCINKLTEVSQRDEDIEGTDLKNLFKKFPIVIINKLQSRLECIKTIKPANDKIKLPEELKQFHSE
jgi:hypothetical protein